ncbi:MAG: HlyD family secretion protein [Verrucomicrobia bacterium]|nr:HlyD family secretion protein [Verrucomicrobiota bacterium]
MTREDKPPVSAHIEVAEEEAKHHFTPDGAQDQQKEDKKSKRNKRRLPIKWILIALVVLLIAGFFGFRYWQYASTHESTDDAYTTNHLHQISPRINGTVQRVLVDDNVRVKAGQVLVELDPRDFEVSLAQAQANLSAAQAAVAQSEAQLEVAKANVGQAQANQASAQANADNVNADQKRNTELLKKRVISPQDMDHANEAARSGNASLAAAKKQVAGNEAQVALASAQVKAGQAQVQQAQEAVDQAKLNVSYTKIVSPADGQVGQRTVESGNRVQPGQALMAISEPDVWVLANLKETQMEKVRVGQPVAIRIDSFPHQNFSGWVDSVQPGSGATYALLPPDNATGNFIKIVQRVPVKVVFDPGSLGEAAGRIVPGLSCEPSIAVTAPARQMPENKLADTKR